MLKTATMGLSLSMLAIFQLATVDGAEAGGWKLISEQTVSGFNHPSSVACDIWNNMIYVSDYGPELEPTSANDKGTIFKLSDKGKILDRDFFASAGATFPPAKGLSNIRPQTMDYRPRFGMAI